MPICDSYEVARHRRFSEWVTRHPLHWSLIAGVIAALSAWAGSGLWVVGVFLGILVFALSAWLWRRDGPAQRWLVTHMQQHPPEDR